MIESLTIPSYIADQAEQWITSRKVPWYYFNNTLGDKQEGWVDVDPGEYTIRDMPRFTHYFYPNSQTPKQDNQFVLPLVEWVRNKLLPKAKVVRVMGNLTTPTLDSQNCINIPHVDSDNENMYTFLYYVNNSDGKTVFFKDRKIVYEAQPIKGTGVWFQSNTPHAGQVPFINKTRYVINIGFRKRV
jgi:hypothetical protein